MQTRQFIGIGLVGAAILGIVVSFVANMPAPLQSANPVAVTIPPTKPIEPVKTTVPTIPATTTPTTEWQHFQCRRGKVAIVEFKQARAVFVGRKGTQVSWKIFTPAKNTDTTAYTFEVNSDRVVCSYVKAQRRE